MADLPLSPESNLVCAFIGRAHLLLLRQVQSMNSDKHMQTSCEMPPTLVTLARFKQACTSQEISSTRTRRPQLGSVQTLLRKFFHVRKKEKKKLLEWNSSRRKCRQKLYGTILVRHKQMHSRRCCQQGKPPKPVRWPLFDQTTTRK